MSDEHPDKKVWSLITQSTFFHVIDATEIGKLKLFAGHYKKGDGAKQVTRHYVDVTSFRPVLHDLSWGKTVEFDDMKGSPDAEGKLQSRILNIKCGENRKGNSAVFLSFKAGPGEAMGEGAVKPAGQPTIKVNVMMTKMQARQMAYDVLEFLTAVRTKALIAGLTQSGEQPRITVQEMVDELGLGFQQPSPVTAAPKPVTPVQQLGPEQAYLKKLYLNGVVVAQDDLNNYQFFCEQKGGPPANRETLMGFVYS